MDDIDILMRNKILGGESCGTTGGMDIAADSRSTSAV